MKSSNKIILLAVLITASLFVTGLAVQEEADAELYFSGAGQGSITPDGGTVYAILVNQDGSDKTVTLSVTYNRGGATHEVGSGTFIVPGGETGFKASIPVELGGVGEYNLTITATPDYFFRDGANSTSLVVTVAESIWSGWTPYIALIAVALLAVIAVFIHMRSKPRVQPDRTFTEIEQDRRSGRSGEAPETAAARRRYSSAASGKPAEATKPGAVGPEPAEPKAANFTELAREKQGRRADAAKPAEKDKKKDAGGKPAEKLKYVSSRRK